MKLFKSFKPTIAALTIASAVFSTSSNAAIVPGSQIDLNNITGYWAIMDNLLGNTYSNGLIGTANAIDFVDAAPTGSIGTNAATTIGLASGSFSGLQFDTVSVADIRWDTNPNEIVSNPFLEVTTGPDSFELSISSFDVTQTATTLDIHGTGIITFNGMVTDASWILSANDASGQQTASLIVNTATSVPEPSAAALLGLGLAGLALGRRRAARK